MRRIFIVGTIIGIVVTGTLATIAQQGHGAHSTPAAGSSYADRVYPSTAIRSLTPEVIAQIEWGGGAGIIALFGLGWALMGSFLWFRPSAGDNPSPTR